MELMMPISDMQEPALYLECDLERGESHRIADGLAVAYSARAPGKPSCNEDSVALIPCGPGAGVLVVADGLGGMPAGEQASALAVQCLADALHGIEPQATSLREAILDGMEHANQAVSALGVGAATTLAVVEIQHRVIRPYHAGDSLILVTGQRGKIKLQAVPHSPIGYAVEAGFLNAEEAMHHEERHLISNMIGTPDMRIEVGAPVLLSPRDTLVLASDGLSDNLHIDEIVAEARIGSLPNACKHLVESCQTRMMQPSESHPSKPDDLSLILFRLLT
ncbi:MAG: protein phosphatase 2C domain-containing protein [Gammaproteobacteria bacterium]